jgi:hypothetical protein
MSTRSGLLSYRLTNAILGWVVIAILAVVAVERALAGELLWSGMAVVVIGVALVPPVLARRPTEMLAWEVLALSALPAVLRSFDVLVGVMAYVSVATLALAIVVELDAFTAVEMTPGFSVVFVVIVTMAVASLWTIGRFFSDTYLGTSLISDANAAMWDLVAATAIGVVAGLVFELYFHRLSPGNRLERELWGNLR